MPAACATGRVTAPGGSTCQYSGASLAAARASDPPADSIAVVPSAATLHGAATVHVP